MVAVLVSGIVVYQTFNPVSLPQHNLPSDILPATQKQNDLTDSIDHLKDQLSAEISAREALQQRVEQLERLLTDIGGSSFQLSDYSTVKEAEQSETVNVTSKPVTLKDSLTALGLEQETINSILQHYSNNRMSLLELRNKAQREGWLDTARYDEAIGRFISPGRDIQQEYGDDIYDRFLFANGNTNRVQVSGVYSGSAAQVSGIQIGDIIVSYGPRNIFNMADFMQATTEGVPGEQVLVVVQRNNSTQYMYVPRGPLGVEMEAIRQIPGTNGE